MENKRMLFLLGLWLWAVTTFQLTSGTDIVFYNVIGCQGIALGCYNVGSGVCCAGVPTWSVSFANLPCSSGRVYRGGGCSNQLVTGRGNGCYNCNTDCTAALWTSCANIELVGHTDGADGQSKHCTKTVSPNAVMYTDETTKDTWVLQHETPLMLYEELKNVPDAEKLYWLRARGATLSEHA